jgi:hypothetical protein
MYKVELFTRVRSPYIWQTRKRANAPDIVNRQLSAASERALASIVVSTKIARKITAFNKICTHHQYFFLNKK